MSCCGKERNSVASRPVHAQASAPMQVGPSPASAAAATQRPEFVYHGGGVLSVVGPVSGLQYRFVGYGARLAVDARDRASLARVPQLQEVPPRRY